MSLMHTLTVADIWCHQCMNTHLSPVFYHILLHSTLNEDSVVTSQVSPPGCHPAVCNKRQATTSAIAAMKSATCDDDSSSVAPLRPVTISAGAYHTVRIKYESMMITTIFSRLQCLPHSLYCQLSHAMTHALLLWMAYYSMPNRLMAAFLNCRWW